MSLYARSSKITANQHNNYAAVFSTNKILIEQSRAIHYLAGRALAKQTKHSWSILSWGLWRTPVSQLFGGLRLWSWAITGVSCPPSPQLTTPMTRSQHNLCLLTISDMHRYYLWWVEITVDLSVEYYWYIWVLLHRIQQVPLYYRERGWVLRSLANDIHLQPIMNCVIE